jgi:hypothetical protein
MKTRRSILLAAAACFLGVAPAWAAGEPWRMRLNFALADLPPILLFAALAWTALFLGLAARRLLRPIESPTPRPVALATHLIWMALPALWLAQLLDASAVADKLEALPIAAAWFALALPALLIPPTGRGRKVAIWASLALADIAGGGWLIYRVLHHGSAPHWGWLAAFALILHIAALAPRWGCPFKRVVTVAGVLLLAAQFFRPPAALFDVLTFDAGPVRAMSGVDGPVRHVLFQADGETALVVTEAEPHVLLRVNLADGLPIDRREMPGSAPILNLALNPDGNRAAAVLGGPAPQLLLLDPDLLFTVTELAAELPFTPTAAVLTENRLAVGGDGPAENFLLCDLQIWQANREASFSDICRAVTLPIQRVGSIGLASRRYMAFVAEGGKWLADGWRVQQVSLLHGEIMTRMTFGPSLGQIVHVEGDHSVYTARPDLGLVEVRWGESLDLRGGYLIEPDVRFLAVDFPRFLLLGVSPRTGKLVIEDLRDSRRIAEAPIGSGITALAYDATSGVALIAAARGLVRVNVLELPGIKREY